MTGADDVIGFPGRVGRNLFDKFFSGSRFFLLFFFKDFQLLKLEIRIVFQIKMFRILNLNNCPTIEEHECIMKNFS